MITKKAFFEAVDTGNEEIVKQAFTEKFDINTLSDIAKVTALYLSISLGNVSMTRLLIDNGANLEACTNSGLAPLITAITYLRVCQKEKKPDYLAIIELLLIAGAKPTYINKQGEEEFAYLLTDGHARRQVRDIFVKLGIVEKSKEEIIAEKKTAQSEVVSVKSETQEERTFKKAYLPQPSIFEAITSMFFGQPKGESEDARPLIKSGLKLKKE